MFTYPQKHVQNIKDKTDLISISVIEFDSPDKKDYEEFPSSHSDFYTRLIEEAPFIYGDHGISPKNNKIEWLDEKLIRKGQDFIRQNFFAVMFAHLISLLLIFTFKSGRSVLLRTGENHKKETSVTRYLSTVLHIKLWYETDFIVKTGKSSQDVYAVRKMHGAAAAGYKEAVVPFVYLEDRQEVLLRAIQEDCKGIDTSETPWHVLIENPAVPMSQFDMSVTQFCFLGFVNLHPKMFGIWGKDDEGMDGFVHVWAVLGRLLGIEDRFNLALHVKDRVGYNKIWSNIFMAGFKSIDKYTIVMWDSLIYGLQYYILFMRLNSITQFMITQVANVKVTKNMSNLSSFADKLVYYLMRLGVFLARFSLIRVFLNNFIRLSIFYARIRYMRQGHHLTPPSQARKEEQQVQVA